MKTWKLSSKMPTRNLKKFSNPKEMYCTCVLKFSKTANNKSFLRKKRAIIVFLAAIFWFLPPDRIRALGWFPVTIAITWRATLLQEPDSQRKTMQSLTTKRELIFSLRKNETNHALRAKTNWITKLTFAPTLSFLFRFCYQPLVWKKILQNSLLLYHHTKSIILNSAISTLDVGLISKSPQQPLSTKAFYNRESDEGISITKHFWKTLNLTAKQYLN